MFFSGSEDLESDTLLDGTSYILCGCRRSQRSSAEGGTRDDENDLRQHTRN